jgi:cell division septal protein FtsQ
MRTTVDTIMIPIKREASKHRHGCGHQNKFKALIAVAMLLVLVSSLMCWMWMLTWLKFRTKKINQSVLKFKE